MRGLARSLLAVLAALNIASCADNLSGDVYSRDEARQPMQVSYGVVSAVRPVVLEGDRNMLGQGSGAIIGGIAGNTVGSGSGRSLATAVGAVAGGVAGSMTQEKMTRAQGAEIVVRLDDGSTTAIVQQVEDLREFVPGQRVRIVTSDKNSRVAPLTKSYDRRQ